MFAQRRYPSHLHSPIVLVRKNLVDLWRNPVGDPFKIRDVAWQGSPDIVGSGPLECAGGRHLRSLVLAISKNSYRGVEAR